MKTYHLCVKCNSVKNSYERHGNCCPVSFSSTVCSQLTVIKCTAIVRALLESWPFNTLVICTHFLLGTLNSVQDQRGATASERVNIILPYTSICKRRAHSYVYPCSWHNYVCVALSSLFFLGTLCNIITGGLIEETKVSGANGRLRQEGKKKMHNRTVTLLRTMLYYFSIFHFSNTFLAYWRPPAWNESNAHLSFVPLFLGLAQLDRILRLRPAYGWVIWLQWLGGTVAFVKGDWNQMGLNEDVTSGPFTACRINTPDIFWLLTGKRLRFIKSA